MTKKIFIFCIISLWCINFINAQPIAGARLLPIGSTVTVTGIVTNGSELGNSLRYLQDGTAGIAAFGASLNGVQRGDEVTVTGVLSDYYNLLEIQPVNFFSINSNGNQLPAPVVLTPSQLNEPYEGQLVKIQNVVFTNGGQTFNGNTNYTFTAAGQSGEVRINGFSNIAGTTIPSQPVTVTAICSQYQITYQILPRDLNDIVLSSLIFIGTQPFATNITTTGFNVNWSTNLSAATSFIEYGKTPLLELGTLSATAGFNNVATITGANPAELYYVKCFSVLGNDTVSSGVEVFITASNSTGDIKCYFIKSVDNSVATIQNAIQLPGTVDDTLVAYIGRAKHSIDIAIYNFDDNAIADIAGALNTAYTNGRSVRIVYNSSTTNPAIQQLNTGIHTLGSPAASPYGIMHNKFMVIDADSPDPNDAIVWTGSTNWTDEQMNLDANNVIIIQDQSLARTYKLEFEEMWGSSTNVPDSLNAKFGPYKSDNTPHQFMIGGKFVESYFSPSDNVTNQIINAVNTANSTLYFALLTFTKTDIAAAIAGKVTGGLYLAAGLMDDTSASAGVVYNILSPVMGNKIIAYNHALNPGILHHKYLIVDENDPLSDPLVLTGSHNWSNAAAQKNDENTLIVHDANIANQYYQEFYKRVMQNGGVLGISENTNDDLKSFMLYPNPNNGKFLLSVNLEKAAAGKLTIFNAFGQNMLQKDFDAVQGASTFLMTDDMQPGVYFVDIKFGNTVTVKKMVVE